MRRTYSGLLVGVRHLAPDEQAQRVGPEQPARVFDFLVLAGAVETHLPGQLYVPAQILVRRGGQEAIGEVALVEDEPLVEEAVVEKNLAILYLELAHPEVAVHAVEDLATPVQQLEPQVVEVGVLGAPEGGAGPVGQVRRVGSFAAAEKGQAPFDERGAQVEGVFEYPLSVEFYHRSEAHPLFDADYGNLRLDAGGFHLRGQAEGVDATAVHGLEPDGLPDPGRAGVEDPLRSLLPVLLPPRDGYVSTRVFGSYCHYVIPARKSMRDLGRERRVAALVGGRLADAGELRLVAEGDDYLTVERRAVRAQGRGVRVLPAACKPGVRVVESECPRAVQVDPSLPAKLGTRVLGTRHGPPYHSSRPLRRMTSEYQRALDLGTRRCVPYSTNTMPNRLEYPSAHSKLSRRDHTM